MFDQGMNHFQKRNFVCTRDPATNSSDNNHEQVLFGRNMDQLQNISKVLHGRI